MKCHVCGSKMQSITTDLPFKVNNTTIVIMKELPVIQCDGCSEYLLDDAVMERVDGIIEKMDVAAELEIIRYAA
jgi:YgiT-type zinc finger domain-containing protein